MSLSNYNLFDMINASPGRDGAWSWIGLLLAYGTVWLAIVGLLLLWHHADGVRRHDVILVCFAAVSALVASEMIALLCPQPRPVALHMGVQLNPFPMRGASLPSDETAVLLAMGLAAFGTRALAIFGFPLLTLGLLTAWSLVYTGEHFPYDVAASLPVAAVCAALSCMARAILLWRLRRCRRQDGVNAQA